MRTNISVNWISRISGWVDLQLSHLIDHCEPLVFGLLCCAMLLGAIAIFRLTQIMQIAG